MLALIEAFDEAKRVLLRPDGWCQGAGARDVNGRPCGSTDAGARSWSLYGIVYLAAQRHGADPVAMMRAMDRQVHLKAGIRSFGIGQGIQSFNDLPGQKLEAVIDVIASARFEANRKVPA